jgi:hypothetical protein
LRVPRTFGEPRGLLLAREHSDASIRRSCDVLRACASQPSRSARSLCVDLAIGPKEGCERWESRGRAGRTPAPTRRRLRVAVLLLRWQRPRYRRLHVPEEYFGHIERAKPGDHFTLFELNALLDRAVIHIGNVHSTHILDLEGSTPVTIAGAHRSLQHVLTDEDAEVLVIRRFAGLLTGTVDVTLSQLPGTGDEREVTFKRDLLWGRGDLVMFDQRLFDEGEYGGIVETVTPVERRRIHALVDAKRPSPEGTVPLSGAY